MSEPKHSAAEYKRRIGDAINAVTMVGGIDGGHHKQWGLDRVLRALMDPEDYAQFVEDWPKDDDGECVYGDWDPGIAP